MIYADRDTTTGILNSIRQGCGLAPGHDEACPSAHNDCSPGCERVELAEWPQDGQPGPFTYDKDTKKVVCDPVKEQEAVRQRILASAKALEDAELLLKHLPDDATVLSQKAEAEAAITTWKGKLK